MIRNVQVRRAMSWWGFGDQDWCVEVSLQVGG